MQYNAGQNSNGQIDSKGMYIVNIGGNLAMAAQCWDEINGVGSMGDVNCAVKSYSRNVSSICLYAFNFTHFMSTYGMHELRLSTSFPCNVQSGMLEYMLVDNSAKTGKLIMLPHGTTSSGCKNIHFMCMPSPPSISGYKKAKMDYNLCAQQGDGNIGNLQTITAKFGTFSGRTRGFIVVNDNTMMCVSSVEASQSFFGIQNSKCVLLDLIAEVHTYVLWDIFQVNS